MGVVVVVDRMLFMFAGGEFVVEVEKILFTRKV
jgi:hypothetical protein